MNTSEEVTQDIVIPAHKGDCPKVVCLDENIWIELARVHYGRSDDRILVELLKVLREKRRKRLIYLPFSVVHVMEMTAHKTKEKREKLISFIVGESENVTILPYNIVRPIEILHAIERSIGVVPAKSLRPLVLSRGIPHSLGGEIKVSGLPEPTALYLERGLRDAHWTKYFLSQLGYSDLPGIGEEEDRNVIPELENARKQVIGDMTKEIAYRYHLAQAVESQVMFQMLNAIGIDPHRWADENGNYQKMISFLEDIPTAHVEASLWVERDYETQRAIHENDTRDVVLFSMAIPYCNALFGEKFFIAKAKQRKLDAKYDTVLTSNREEMVKYVREEIS